MKRSRHIRVHLDMLINMRNDGLLNIRRRTGGGWGSNDFLIVKGFF